MKEINSKDNETFKFIKSLLKKKNREENKKFLLEGKKLFLEAVIEKVNILNVIVRDDFKWNFDFSKDNFNFIVLNKKLFSEITEMENSEGIIAICEYISEKEIISNNILLLDGVNDPGNFGTIIRTANAFGIDDILTLNSVDKYNSKILRATMGAVFRTNIVKVTLDDVLKFKNEYNIITTSLNENSKDLDKFNFLGKNIIVMGNEANGVSKDILDISNEFLKISMKSEMESLNVAMASGIIMYEIYKKQVKLY